MPVRRILGVGARAFGQAARHPLRTTTRGVGGALGATARAPRATVRGAGRAGVGGLNFLTNHPGLAIGGAVVAGTAAAQIQSATTPQVQEAFLGAPDALGTIFREQATATMLHGYRPGERENPYDAMTRGGRVLASPNYLGGRPLRGSYVGNITGSRMLGGYQLGGGDVGGVPNRSARIRGSGREQPANGAMVFGMYNLRR